jgi:small GTP-binding protein
MSAIKRKICLLGAFAVGKTSLVRRYVDDSFSEKYLTTVGVQHKMRTLTVATPTGAQAVDLVIWDLAGEDEFQKAQMIYLRGAAGYLLVVDGTRRATLETAKLLHQRALAAIGAVPFILLANKHDLRDEWEIDDQALAELSAQGWPIIQTSAKSGDGVEAAFQSLTEMMLAK